MLESETDVMGLEMDRKRTAEFLDVEFPEKPDVVGGRKNWKLEIKWVPDSMAGGVFPRGDEVSIATAPCTSGRCVRSRMAGSVRISASP